MLVIGTVVVLAWNQPTGAVVWSLLVSGGVALVAVELTSRQSAIETGAVPEDRPA